MNTTTTTWARTPLTQNLYLAQTSKFPLLFKSLEHLTGFDILSVTSIPRLTWYGQGH